MESILACDISWNCLTDRRRGLEQSYWGQIKGWIKYRKPVLYLKYTTWSHLTTNKTTRNYQARSWGRTEDRGPGRVFADFCSFLRGCWALWTVLIWIETPKDCTPGKRLDLKWELQALNLWIFESLILWISETSQALMWTKWCQNNIGVLRCDPFGEIYIKLFLQMILQI